jgi:O-acetyl-ADP-ribose deacetylase (regulator of RNase III)
MNQKLRQEVYPPGKEIIILQGDITQEGVDAIVNAANSRLQHGGGVAGIIVRRGGSTIQQESNNWVRKHGPVSHAAPAYTTGGRLPCRYVIHAVGPIWGEGDEDAKLFAAVIGSLKLADTLKLNSLSLPAISTGIFGFPKERAAKIIFESIKTYLLDHPESNLKQVRLILFDHSTVDKFLRVWDKGHMETDNISE